MNPAWHAGYVGRLAKNGVMGGDVQRILWELPLAIGMQLRHAILQMEGFNTVQSDEDEAAERESIIRSLDDGGSTLQTLAG